MNEAAHERPLPTVIGPTENALRALLVRTLDASAINSYEEWVFLNMTVGAAPMGVVATALGVPVDAVAVVADGLVERGLMGDRTEISQTGRAELTAARDRVAATTRLLTAGIDPHDLDVCAAVLDAIRSSAEQLLAEPSR